MTMPCLVMTVLALSVPFSAVGCGGLGAGSAVPTLDLHAELAAATVFTADVVTGEGAGDAHAWRGAIDDASAAGPGSGIATLAALDGDVLSLRLPFPLASGQSLPIEGEISLSYSQTAFAFPGSGDLAQAGAWLQRCPPGVTDRACSLAERQEVVGGTLRIDSVRPLRAHVTASVSYGDATALTPVALDGALAFAATEGTRCLD